MDWVREKFNRGLSLVRPPGLLSPSEAHRAENFVFTRASAKRRPGRYGAYQPSTTVSADAVAMLKRFYKLGTTGTVTPTLLKSYGSLLAMTTADWDDVTGATVATANWTDLPLPRTSNSSLASGSNVAVTSGQLKNAFESNSWCYVWPQYVAADDADDRTNVPMRTNAVSGTPRTFLMGLTPPGQATTAEISSGSGVLLNGEAYYYKLTAEYDNLRLGESGPGVVSTQEVIGAAVNANVRVTVPAITSSDVSRINIYRTINGGDANGTFYFVGSVAGIAGGTFDDTITDAVLVTRKILESDVYLPPKFRTGCIWKDRAVIGNLKCRNTGSATELDFEEGGIHKNRLRYSRGFKPDSFPQSYFLDIVPDGESGSIQRVIVNPLIDSLFVFMEEDVVALQGDSPTGEAGAPFRPRNVAQSKGTSSPNSVFEAKGLIFYWTKDGIEVIDGFRARNITSQTIAPLWNAQDAGASWYADRVNLDQLALVSGVYVPKEQRIYWAYPSATSAFNNRILVFDIDRWAQNGYGDGAFSIYVGWDVSTFAHFGGESDHGELFGGEANSADSNWVYRLDYGNADFNGSRNGTTITSSVSAISGYLHLGLDDAERPDFYKSWKSLRVQAKSGLCLAHVILDLESGSTLKELGTYDFQGVIGAWGSIVWGAFTWNGPRITRKAMALPRIANAIRAGVRFETVDVLNPSNVGPDPFELYDVSWTADLIRTRVRR